jgi:hypothetical protein
MSEAWKLVIGFVGVTTGFVAGLFGLFALMSSSGGQTLEHRPTLMFLVSVGMCAGGAALVGYLFLSIIGLMEKRSKRASRREKKRRRK